MFEMTGSDALICYIKCVKAQAVQLQFIVACVSVMLKNNRPEMQILSLVVKDEKHWNSHSGIITAVRWLLLNFNKISATCHCFPPAPPDPLYWRTQQVNQLRSKEKHAKA